jgi:hypothetical protein
MPTTNPMIQRASLLLPTDEDGLMLENSAGELAWLHNYKRYLSAAFP